jgi:hypothetical protein
MGGLVSSLAFPVPKLPQSFYHDLLKRRDLVWLETKKGERIPALHIQAPLRRRRNVTLLFSHGNAEDIALHLPFVTALAHRTGADVFSYEYVGYGPSRFKDCVPSERGCYRAIDAAWDYLLSRGVDPTSTVEVLAPVLPSIWRRAWKRRGCSSSRPSTVRSGARWATGPRSRCDRLIFL